jgi:twitching motility two-component system response regulator PilH
MNGLQLCEAIRGDPELRHIPVVVVSGSIAAHDERARACFTAFVDKPFTPDDLLARLNDALADPHS